MVDLSYIKELLGIFDKSSITKLLIDDDDAKILLLKAESQTNNFALSNTTKQNIKSNNVTTAIIDDILVPTEKILNVSNVSSANNSIQTENNHTVFSPMVGTFYKAPSPDAAPFVQIGSHINKGDTLCIIEAMKLMNEIEADISGTIIKILTEDAQAVEFNQPLFIIKPE